MAGEYASSDRAKDRSLYEKACASCIYVAAERDETASSGLPFHIYITASISTDHQASHGQHV
jgi:hypothetical protein